MPRRLPESKSHPRSLYNRSLHIFSLQFPLITLSKYKKEGNGILMISPAPHPLSPPTIHTLPLWSQTLILPISSYCNFHVTTCTYFFYWPFLQEMWGFFSRVDGDCFWIMCGRSVFKNETCMLLKLAAFFFFFFWPHAVRLPIDYSRKLSFSAGLKPDATELDSHTAFKTGRQEHWPATANVFVHPQGFPQGLLPPPKFCW